MIVRFIDNASKEIDVPFMFCRLIKKYMIFISINLISFIYFRK